MKEYKVVNKPTTITFSYEKYNKELEDFLNDYARQGWRIIETSQDWSRFLLERDKN